MKLVKNISEISENFSVTIGNFDGVHLGHQSILKKIIEENKKQNFKVCIITFVPHPIQILSPRDNFLINSYIERRNLLKELGIDYLVEIDFNRDLSTMKPEAFMDNFIVKNNFLKKFYVGHDFAFGANKSGDSKFIKKYLEDKSIEVTLLEQVDSKKCKMEASDVVISSTSVRKAIIEGDIELATLVLGRPFYLSGRVIKGAGRGKQIGIPTANLELDARRIHPKIGVYATYVTVDSNRWEAVTNIGFNPTFNDELQIHIESHLLDFNQDIYGKEIKLEFLKKIREEKKFSSVNELVSQIKKDIEEARKLF